MKHMSNHLFLTGSGLIIISTMVGRGWIVAAAACCFAAGTVLNYKRGSDGS